MKNNKDKINILESFPSGDRDSVQKILSAAETSKGKSVVTADETEEALALVRNKLRLDNRIEYKGKHGKPVSYNGLWTIILSAAAVLSIFFAYTSYFSVTTIAAPLGEQLSYQLPDGSQILLNSGTTITYIAAFGKSTRSVNLHGEAFFDVVRNEVPFYVNTTSATVQVTGTAFQVRSWEEDEATSVMLDKGSVLFYATANPSETVRLEAGESSRLSNIEMRPTPPSTFNRQVSFAWQENQFAYQNTPVRSILKDLERRFNTTINVDDTELIEGTLSTFYSGNVRLETLLQDICTVKGLSFSKTANGYRIYAP